LGGRKTGTGVFNGDLGQIVKIDDVGKRIKVRFDDEKIVWYEYSGLEELEHSYATTIHKSQGSEFDAVIMPIHGVAPQLLIRNILYTGITRAKKLLVLIGTKETIEYMIRNGDVRKRNTGLEYKLKNS